MLEPKLDSSGNKKSSSDSTKSSPGSTPELGPSASTFDNKHDTQIQEAESTNASYTPEEVQKLHEEFLDAALYNKTDRVIEMLKNPVLDVNVRSNCKEYDLAATALHIATLIW
ncbi:MAG: hypothetical protein ISN64_01680 [Rickettsia sp.]|nr:hypothetical protein [Rickettsia sp.]